MSATDPVPRKPGLQHLDLIVAGCALLVSVVSLFVAWQNNNTQERMLAASVWPDLDWETNNLSDDLQQQKVSLEIRNVGIGPARIQSLQLFYRGQAIASGPELVKACCQTQAAGLPGPRAWNELTSTINPLVLPAHDSVKFFSVPLSGDNKPLWDALDQARHEVVAQVCYCSVLNQCWMLDSTKAPPREVRSCAVPEPQYH
jgi:hypothetical protein